MYRLLTALALINVSFLALVVSTNAQDNENVFARDNLVAWCIVPFDSQQRTPAQRAQMISDLGLRRVAYDWRETHVPTFEQEILEYQRQGIEYFAFWGTHDAAFALFEKHGLSPQIWQMIPEPPEGDQQQRVKAAAEKLLPLVTRTRQLGSKLGLYNHGGWGGEPANMVAVCQYLRSHHGVDHVGIIYNLHHGHAHIDRFAELFTAMKPFLLCVNLNGMTSDGEAKGKKILPLGAGDHDVRLLNIIRSSGYTGPIGIIGHTQDDVAERLQDNLDGLDWLLPQLDGQPPLDKPAYRTWPPQPDATDEANESSVIDKWIARANKFGDSHRGLVAFGSAKSACLSCHRIGEHGGTAGPDLQKVLATRTPGQIVESVLWPARHVEPEYRAQRIVTDDGVVYRGYVTERTANHVALVDPSKTDAEPIKIAGDTIEIDQPAGTLMPENLLATMNESQATDLFRFLFELGRDKAIPIDEMNALLMHAGMHAHGPAEFEPERKPLEPEYWPSWQEPVNRGRVYDFYAKQADHFRNANPMPSLLAEYPGLDGGQTGHWGNQDEATWSSNLWNELKIGSVLCQIFRGDGITVARGVCVRLGEDQSMSVCFNPDKLTYEALWSGGFVKFSTVRHGFMDGALLDGDRIELPSMEPPTKPFQYRGFYRIGNRVAFVYRIGEQEFWDSPWVANGRFVREVAPVVDHPLYQSWKNASPQWPQTFETEIVHGANSPYAIDTIRLPANNPWKSSFFFGGHDVDADGSIVVATMRGDVWRVSDVSYPSRKATWRKIASGLNQPLGVVVDDDGIFVVGRDQITRLHDLNHDGETDFYECFSNAYKTSTSGHDFICGLQRDSQGNFYIASGNQGLVRISPDGRKADVVATGFRNPDGLGITPDGLVTVPCSEGTWTPASMICAAKWNQLAVGDDIPHFGYHGPKNEQPPELPMVYLPRGLDNSSGGQISVTSDRWGPLQNQLLHFSFGTGTHFLVLRDEVGEQLQGAVVPLPGEFRSGVHRGRFSPTDGQLYVSGMQGWGSYTPDGGCLQRVRYTGEPVQFPIGFRTHQNGVRIEFSQSIDSEIASKATNHFAQCWNYRYSSAYGSPEFSTKHDGIRGHDVLAINAAHVSDDGKSLFVEIPEVQPVNQLHLRLQIDQDTYRELFVTIHRLDDPFTDFPGFQPITKEVRRHPILSDLARVTKQVPNPFQSKIDGARSITIKTGTNLTFQTTEFRVAAGESLALTLQNPDVVPHNWALIRPGTLANVGDLANRLISDPDAAITHYIPDTDDVLAYTDVVLPKEKFTIYFRVPEETGRYPFLCTFPGHWTVMNGVMIVE